MKTDTKNTLLAYEKPVSKEIRMRVQGLLCASFGDGGEAGSDGDVTIDPDEY